MALDSVSLSAAIAWKLSRTNTGFKATEQGQDSKSYKLTPAVGTIQQMYGVRLTINAAATQTLDLTSLTNLVQESVTLNKIVGILLIPTGTNAACKLEPGDTNGLEWFFGGTTPSITIPTGGCFFFAEPSPGETVDGSNKTLKITNTGSGTMTLDVVLVGGTA